MRDVSSNAEASTLERALMALEATKARLNQVLAQQREPIAVVGMACRFPGGIRDANDYWAFLRGGRDAVGELPPERWPFDEVYDPNPGVPGKSYCRHGAFLDDVDRFDAAFFGIPPREAASMDPQQRLLLQVSWEALEHAGIPPGRLQKSATGVFVGIAGNNDYPVAMLKANASLDAYSLTGAAVNVASGRISYQLGLRGPSLIVDTACSSSLMSVHLACQSLRQGECDVALAGGVNVIASTETSVCLAQTGALSPMGRCRTFDAAADGYVRSEGCGIVVLKRLSSVTPSDRVFAVIRGSATNQDGRSNGLTAPNGAAQAALIARTLEGAGTPPREVGYVEAHGTGTPLGDPIELQALGEVLRPERASAEALYVGSVKTNLGHTEAAAGIAGLLKTILSLHHREIPPHLHFQKPSPNVDWEAFNLRVPTTCMPWPEGRPAAGVNSFGVSGTNVHIVLGPAPVRVAPESVDAGAHLLLVSAGSKEGLERRIEALRPYLQTATPAALRDLCHTSALHREHLRWRAGLLASTPEELRTLLDACVAHERAPGIFIGPEAGDRAPRCIFVFSGQGSQWLGMARDLLGEDGAFQRKLKEVDACLQPFLGWSVLERLASDTDTEAWLSAAERVQPILFALQVSLAEQLRAWGVIPTGVVGHSMGEIAAAHVAGCLDLQDAARVVSARARLLPRLRGKGGMLVAGLGLEAARQALRGFEDRVGVAAINGPDTVLLSGENAALDALAARISEDGTFCRRVGVDFASHCPQVDELLPDFRELLADVRPSEGTLDFYSTVEGERVEGTRLDADYWARNLRQMVRFAPTVAAIAEGPRALFVEVSGHPVLTPTFASLANTPRCVATLRRDQPSRAALLASLAELHTEGLTPDWASVHGSDSRCVDYPNHPWQPERHWFQAGVGPWRKQVAPPEPRGPEGDVRSVVRDEFARLMESFSAQLRGGGAALVSEPAPPRTTAAPDAPFALQDAALTPEARREQLTQQVHEEVARTLGISASRLPRDQKLQEVGFTSMLTLMVRNWLRSQLQVALPASVQLPGLSVNELAERVLAELEPSRPLTAPPTSVEPLPTPAPGPVEPPSLGGVLMQDGWFPLRRPRRTAPSARLFCLPFAGGGASAYRAWPGLLGEEDIEVLPIQLPGRETRRDEPAFQRMAPLVSALVEALSPLLDVPYAFYGHSFGAVLAYEVSARLIADGRPPPRHLFVGARGAPHAVVERPLFRLSDERLIEELRRMGGTPEQVLAERDLMSGFLPVLRADFSVLGTHVHARRPPLPCPIDVFAGASDPRVPVEHLSRWSELTSAGAHVHVLPGGHFFLQQHAQELVDQLRARMTPRTRE
ncbi:type I polyketide synthase [Myxococcus sp. AM010]|uniref:type I polyketide synthase n=1 Tax=Myxococcus sp. AM010 TaxID=2745138 RepID=UPI001596282E|nr:type I polyketide synthase [Myxococcus sp. AM010]NVJ15823.1 acyltransferase domain-containing protein [Myxococcus sp. AM010]